MDRLQYIAKSIVSKSLNSAVPITSMATVV